MNRHFQTHPDREVIFENGIPIALLESKELLSLSDMIEGVFDEYLSIFMFFRTYNADILIRMLTEDQKKYITDLSKALNAFIKLQFTKTATLTGIIISQRRDHVPDLKRVSDEVSLIQTTFGLEFKKDRFKVLTDSEAEIYEETYPFEIFVSEGFPEIAGDILEINKCLALGRYTACVFHCMRVLEVGVHKLALYLDLPLNDIRHGKPNTLQWNDLCDSIKTAVNKLSLATEIDRTKRFRCEDMLERLSTLRPERNRVMHARHATTKTYTKEKATHIRAETRDLMQSLYLQLRGTDLVRIWWSSGEAEIQEPTLRKRGTRLDE